MSEPNPTERAEIVGLYDRGLYVQAYRRALVVGDPLGWRAAEACVLGARLLSKVGAPRAATLLTLRAYRSAPEDPALAYRYVHTIAAAQGPLAVLERLAKISAPAADPTLEADLRLERAVALAELRDFSAAEYELLRAEQLSPTSPWSWTNRGAVLMLEDRHEEALAALQQALAIRPDYPPALGGAAHALLRLGRADAAEALLADAVTRIECGDLVLRLAHLEVARERPDAARGWLERAAPLFPCPEPELLRMLAGMASQVAYEAGDRDEAVRLARAAGTPGLLRLAERLESGVDARRVRLAVPSVRQAHKTCAPATLASISLYFGAPAEHLAIADEICFDGTTAASARTWAEQRGFAAREFTVTWDGAVALLERGLPFAMSTQEATSAHAQAVIGFDATTRTFAIRDPSAATVVLVDADILLRAQAWCGPHGLALAPADRAAELAALPLADSELHDLAHAAAVALRSHARAQAGAAVRELSERAPDHAITVAATRSLAGYDGNPAALLAVVERQLATHPESHALRMLQLRGLAMLGQSAERRALLERLAGGPPFFDQLLAEDLLVDGRAYARAEALLRRCLRLMPDSPAAYHTLALLRLRQARPDEARRLLRFATCLGDHESGAAALYVSACQLAGALTDALAFLHERFERHGRRFAEPARALFLALDGHARSEEALAVLEQAIAWRPEDGELLLFAARARADFGQMDRARDLLARARGHAPEAAWQGVAAHLDVLDGELAAARERHALVIADNPLALAAYRAIAPLDAALDGSSVALARVEAAAARFPQNAALARLRVDWTPDEGDAGLAALRNFHAVAPDDLEGACELALRLGRRGELAEAQALVDHVRARAPEAAIGHGMQAQLALWRGEDELALASLHAAITADVDAVTAIAMLVANARSEAGRAAAVAHVRAELRRQISDGTGLTMYRRVAGTIDAPADILALLTEFRATRPELLAAWTESARQLAAMQRLDEARELAAETTRRFPLQVEAHLVHAEMLGRGLPGERRHDAQIAALEAAVALAPGAPGPRIALAQALAATGRNDRAIDLLTVAVRRNPLVADLHAALAMRLWDDRQHRAALARLVTALEVDPTELGRWEQLANMSEETGDQAFARAAAERLAAARPQSGWARLGVATLLGDDRRPERLAALDAAIVLDPRVLWAHDERARLLALAGEWDAALAACAPPIYGRPPLRLRGRAAWIRRLRGELEQARADITALVAEDPSYGFGWCLLGDWAREDGEPRVAAEAYRNALRHEPDATHVAAVLFDLEYELGERVAAARTISTLRNAGAFAQADHAELRLVLARDGQHAALALFERKACDPTVDPGVLTAALALFSERVETDALQRCLEQTLARPDARPVVGRLWISALPLAPFELLTTPRRLRALRARGEIGVEATSMYLQRLAHRRLGVALWLYLAREASQLRAHVKLWAIVGAVLRLRGWYRQAHRWFADWAARDGLEPWMLRHVAACLRWADEVAQARAASTRALALPGAEVEHPLWLALDAATGASATAANEALAPISLPENSDALDRWVFARCKALLAARDRTMPVAQRRALVRGYVAESEACGATRADRVILRRLRPRLDRRIAELLRA